MSAYASPASRGYREDAPLAQLDDPTVEKVTDETYVVGPDDHTWRFPWWVAGTARGGDVLAPAPADAPSQVIDARDMAAWMVDLLERG